MITDMTQEDELVMLRAGGRELGKITARLYRTMRAATIEMHLNGSHAGMQWILGAIPPEVDEGDGLGWDGVESAQAWFDRVMAADKAAEAQAPTADEGVITTCEGCGEERDDLERTRTTVDGFALLCGECVGAPA